MVFGAMLGVGIDRTYRWFEGRRCIGVVSSYFSKVPKELLNPASINSGDRRCNNGIRYTVKNWGSTDVPDHFVELRSLKFGTLIFHSSDKEGALLPGQERVHSGVVEHYKGARTFKETASRWLAEDAGEVYLQIVMVDSERVLARSRVMGQALLTYLATGEETSGLYTHIKPWSVGYWLHCRREKKKFNETLRKAEPKAEAA